MGCNADSQLRTRHKCTQQCGQSFPPCVTTNNTRLWSGISSAGNDDDVRLMNSPEGAGITHKQLNNLIGGYTCRPTYVRTWQHPHHVQISCQCSSRCGGFTSINSTAALTLLSVKGEICLARVDTPFHQNCFTKIVCCLLVRLPACLPACRTWCWLSGHGLR